MAGCLVTLLLATGCSTAPPIGPAASSTAEVELTPSATTTPSADALKIDLFIDSRSVRPKDADIDIKRGRNVLLVTHTDHDVSITVKGPGIDKTVAVGRLMTIVTAFVANEVGTITVRSTDPAATLVRLHVT